MPDMVTISDEFGAMLGDEKLTVGAEYEIGPHLVTGNMRSDCPEQSVLSIDQFGRIWKEKHTGGFKENGAGGEHKMVCVLDLRQLAAAIDAGPK